MKIIYKSPSIGLFYTIFFLNAFIYGLVYFFPQSEIGEPNIPTYLKLLLDVLFLYAFFVFGLKKNLSHPQALYFFYLITVIAFGFIHSFHIGLTEFLHYSVRNVVFYGFFLFISFFPRIDLNRFESFHEKVFKGVLTLGLLLFLLKSLEVPNPFAFGYWFWEKNRLISTWLNPNSFGFYMMFYLIYFYFKTKKITLITLFIIGSIFLSGSLTAIIGVFFFMGYLILKLFANTKFRFKHLFIVISALPILIYFFNQYGVFDYMFYKVDILFVKKSEIHTSVSTRVENIYNLIDYLDVRNIHNIILGDFSAQSYIRLDNQYLNIFYNYGFLSTLIFSGFLFGLLNHFYINRKHFLSRTFFLFSVWLFVFGFNLTAYLYRVNVVVFYFIMLTYYFAINDVSKQIKEV